MRFTAAQQEAYQATGENVLVSAGAGSGKTQVLSERVRYLVQEKGYRIDEFLILTFTNLAAGEMKERIRKKLQKAAPEEAKRIDSAYICTFDSFALAMVKKYHMLLNISKTVSVLPENISSILIHDEIDRILEELYQQKDALLKEMVQRFCYRSDKELRELLFSLYQNAVSSLDEERYLEDLKEKAGIATVNRYLMEYQQRIDGMVYDLRMAASDISNQTYVRNLDAAFAPYDGAGTLTEKIDALKKMKYPAARNIEEQDAVEAIRNLKKELKAATENFTSEQTLLSDALKNRSYTEKLTDIVRDLLRVDREYKDRVQCYSFSDIAKMAIRLFQEHPEIARELRDSLKTIMIDEYQDTSAVQEAFISLIQKDNVYMVGDVKQSIYRFRKATPELFIEKFGRYKRNEGGKLISLSDNFRSRPEVLDDINEIFADIMTEELGGANYREDHMIGKGNLSYARAGQTPDSRHTELYFYPEESLAKEEAEARIIAEDIIDKMQAGYPVYNGDMEHPALRAARLSDFCILMDRGSSFETYQRIFSEYKIPLFVENNVDISSNPLILAVTNLLKLVRYTEAGETDSPRFRHCYLSLGRSFLFERSDEELYADLQGGNVSSSPLLVQVQALWKRKKPEGVYAFLTEAIRELKIYEKLIRIGDIALYEKNLDSFIDSLLVLHRQGYGLDGFIHYFERVREIGLKMDVPSSSTEFDSVRMMNIFKSKGLEFPIIYCAGLTKTFNEEKYRKSFYVSDSMGIVYPGENRNHTVLFDLNREKEREEDLSEKIRLLYVSLTRAKEKIICLFPETMKPCAEKKARSLGDLLFPAASRFASVRKKPKEELVPFSLDGASQREPVRITREDVAVELKPVQMERASKTLQISSASELLEKGQRLHAYMETVDFLHPDLSQISDPHEKSLIRRFLQSEIFRNLRDPKIYKEYEFSDEIHRTRGIIDCLILDGDVAYIIDYKLKRIDDAAYDRQLSVYAEFVESHFRIRPVCCLYSLLDSAFRFVEWNRKQE